MDHLHDLLGTHDVSDNLLHNINHLVNHGTVHEINDFASGLESSGIESSHDGNDYLYGGTGDDVLLGMGGDDHLYGGDGHDILFGGSGNDILVGGKDDDVLVGGSGNDVFKCHAGDLDGVVHGDTITDFHAGNHDHGSKDFDPNADVLDIGELLTGSNKPESVHDLFSGGFLQFDEIKQNDDGTTTAKLSIDTDGSANNAARMTHLATITMSGRRQYGSAYP